MSFESLSEFANNWTSKTLMMLHDGAVAEESGVAFDALRLPDVKRTMMVICLTSEDRISVIEQAMKLSAEPDRITNWDEISLADLVATAGRAGGLAYEEIKGPDGKRHAIALGASGTKAVDLISTFLQIPS